MTEPCTKLLLEIGTEELPPTALATLSAAFSTGIVTALKEKGLTIDSFQPFATPRRLALLINNLAVTTPDREIEKLGPNIKAAYDKKGQPSKAAIGFAASCGVSIEQLSTKDTTKGERLVFVSLEKGQPVSSLLEDIVNDVLSRLPIAKRMRWGERRDEFIRPVQWVLALMDDKPITLTVFGVTSGTVSHGHRFHCSEDVAIPHAKDYEKLLEEQGKVITDYNKRKNVISQQLKDCASTVGGEVVIGEALLDEVCGLVEWPHALVGNFDKSFLELPQEALISSMRAHQKYFHGLDAQGKLLPCFVTVANIDSKNPDEVIRGNERVIRPRLADAQFFYRTDAEKSLEQHAERLESIVFQTKLGSIGQKVQRIATLSTLIATEAGFNDSVLHTHCQRTAELCKADLVTEMVGEFADLQGTMGRYYAIKDNEEAEVATAIEEHYLPRFAGDTLAVSMTGLFVGLADRLDTLVGIFGIGQTPTGSKDPFALRRAALAILRMIIEKGLPLDLKPCIQHAINLHESLATQNNNLDKLADQVLNYILDRQRSWYTEQGIAVENYLAVHSKQLSAPLDIDARVKAVQAFAALEEAATLAAANKRVSNILSKLSSPPNSNINKSLLKQSEETALIEALTAQQTLVQPLIAKQQYTQALEALTALKQPVDAFFDSVMVMDDDLDLRANRLALLQQLNDLFMQIADISKLASSQT